MRSFVATIPIQNAEPVWGPVAQRANLYVYREDKHFSVIVQRGNRQETMAGYYLGRLASQYDITRPAVIVAAAKQGVREYLESLASGDNSYRFEYLDEAWKSAAKRQILIDMGIPYIPAVSFQALDGTRIDGVGRPTLPVVYCGQNYDPFAPNDPEQI